MNSDEDDIEMIGFEDLEDGARQKLLPQQKNVEEREEREEEEGDETTLLNGSHERRERSAGVVQRFWPQVKDIVIEVRVANADYFFHSSRPRPPRPCSLSLSVCCSQGSCWTRFL